MSGKKPVGFCPHCCSRTPQRLVHTQPYLDVLYDMAGNLSERDVPFTYYVAVCEGCDQVLLYHELEDVPDGSFTKLNLLYPKDGSLHSGVPERVRRIYGEAFRIRYVAPSAYAVQIRRALEAIAEDRGAAKGSLAKRLAELANRGEMPPVLAEMTQVLRLLGNIGAHAAEEEVRPGQVLVIEEFFRAVIEYIYVGPSRIAEFKKRLNQLEDGGIAES